MSIVSVVNKKIRFWRIFLGLLTIGIVFISGCVQEKAQTSVPNQSPTIVPTTQPSATPAGDATLVSGATLVVDKNGGGNYTRIQDAINDSNYGDTVLVEDTDFKFSNKCEIREIPRASNGSLLACIKAGGEKINVTFTGTTVSVVSFGSPNGGIVKVRIDGKEYPEINTVVAEETVPWTLESGLRVIQRIAITLQNTSHMLTFEITNKSTIPSGNPNEAGDIYIDAVEIKKE